MKVLDFGLARRVSQGELEAATRSDNSLDAPGVLAGTLAGMSPEVLRGEPADERSDLWALGVLLHQLSSGALPFTGATSFDLTSRILTDHPAPLPDRVPSALRAIIARLLDKDAGTLRLRSGSACGAAGRAAARRPPTACPARLSPSALHPADGARP